MEKGNIFYTKDDCGCYVDVSRGTYSTDMIVNFARSHGANIQHDTTCTDHNETCYESEFAGCEWADGYEDEANDFMNDHFAVPCCFWGRNDEGDWGLWPEEHDER